MLLSGETDEPARGIPGLRSPMVGRDGEVALLTSLLRRVADDRRGHLVTVYGDPGVGKSRLVAEFTAGAGARVVRGRCLPYGDGITFWPLAEIVKAEAGVHDTDPPEVALRRIRGLGEAEPVGRAGDAAVELTAARSPVERARALAELAQLADLAARARSWPDDGESRGGDEHAGEAAVDEAGASGVAE